MTVTRRPIVDIQQRLQRRGVSLVRWDTDLQMYCERCGELFSASGFIGGDVNRPGPENSWWKCPNGCNASSSNPLTDQGFFDQELSGVPTTPVSTFEGVVRRKRR